MQSRDGTSIMVVIGQLRHYCNYCDYYHIRYCYFLRNHIFKPLSLVCSIISNKKRNDLSNMRKLLLISLQQSGIELALF